MVDLKANLQKYLSPEELAVMLGVAKTTVYGWTSDRIIPFIKIGRLVRFDPIKISNWLKQKSIPCIKDLS
ncbi:MAG: helix-turn-helix domain-containing protein [Candidatus Omnitrophica bacterium]|nr:helix-turn-helix domain-containing protein [Candidatus Omnitrophota bacterium]